MSIITLHDPASGSSAEILTEMGFNCFRFETRPAGKDVQWLWSHPNFASGEERPSRSGIPILFPFPGRIAKAAYRWKGREYRLSGPMDDFGNAIHGFVHTRPWRVIEESGTVATGEFHASVDDPGLLNEWPSDFRIRATYELRGSVLRLTLVADNPGSAELPFTLGAHPYFRVPLGGPSARDCVVRLPVARYWELEELIPTGRRLPVEDAARLQSGETFGQLDIDAVFTDLLRTDGKVEASVADPESGHRLTIRSDGVFRECVVFTPPHRDAICIEPYTGAPGAIQLHEQGIDAGLRVLQPGESFSATIEMITH
jgi:aldose 1-epimerase